MPARLRTDMAIAITPYRSFVQNETVAGARVIRNYYFDPVTNRIIWGLDDGMIGFSDPDLFGPIQTNPFGPFAGSGANTAFDCIIANRNNNRITCWDGISTNLYQVDSNGDNSAFNGGNYNTNSQNYFTLTGSPNNYSTNSGDELIFSSDFWTNKTTIVNLFPGASTGIGGYQDPFGRFAVCQFVTGAGARMGFIEAGVDPTVQANWQFSPALAGIHNSNCIAVDENANRIVAMESNGGFSIWTRGGAYVALPDADIWSSPDTAADACSSCYVPTLGGFVFMDLNGTFMFLENGTFIVDGIMTPQSPNAVNFTACRQGCIQLLPNNNFIVTSANGEFAYRCQILI